MHQGLRIRRLRSGIVVALVAAALPGCLWWQPVEVEPPTAPPSLDAKLEGDLDATIDEALPEVSYRSENPAINDPLGPEDTTVTLPRIETLDGESRIVCRKSDRHVFGRCAFPSPAAP